MRESARPKPRRPVAARLDLPADDPGAGGDGSTVQPRRPGRRPDATAPVAAALARLFGPRAASIARANAAARSRLDDAGGELFWSRVTGLVEAGGATSEGRGR